VRPQNTVSFDYTPHKDTLVTQIASNKKALSQIGPSAIIAILIEHLKIDPPPQGLLFNESFLA
jgi:hypothetical protein